MRILMLNVPHPSIGSSISDHLPPLGLLSIAGPLIDAGYSVNLIDGEIGARSERDLLASAKAAAPDVVLLGHCGSTSAHPVIARVARSVRLRLPHVVIVYGGVYPTYHWREILAAERSIDIIVRGEGEHTCLRVIDALVAKEDLAGIPGIAYRNVDLSLVASARADDIVRDANILHLYKRAGFERLLLGTENTDEETLFKIAKGSSTATDRQAVRLLRRHNILSLATYAVGFGEETDRDYWRALRQLLILDVDQISIVYATPHRWTSFYSESSDRRVVQTDLRWWDYKHQVLATQLPAWRIFVWVKLIEAAMQLRPAAIRRTLGHQDSRLRAAMRWYTGLGRQVWPREIVNFFSGTRRTSNGPAVRELWGEPQEHEGFAMAVPSIIAQASTEHPNRHAFSKAALCLLLKNGHSHVGTKMKCSGMRRYH
jgi:radical SAM superfamily enzyme YgiQ (UPF0313 family)